MSRKLNIPRPIAQVLLNRGITSFEEGERFLNPSLEHLHSPFEMKDMEYAARVLADALEKGEKIAIYGDYDVDGVTATSLIYLLLQRLGGDILFYIPNRWDDGYGINREALLSLKEKGASLILTVDCGIKAVEEISYATRLGLNVIITDHHRPSEELPPASAVVNPWRKDCDYPFKELCGTGVAFKLAQALLHLLEKESDIWEYLYLVALATVADVVPLQNENRILVAHGLKQMQKSLQPGLKALFAAVGLEPKNVTSEEIAFVIAPKLNAAGRMGDASRSLHLLLETKDDAALAIASELLRTNSQRQAVEAKIFEEACCMVDEEYNMEKGPFILVLARKGWHQGVLGVVASKMAERYRCPTIMLSLEEGMGKGSGRSFGGFDLLEALKDCGSLLFRFGGHAAAVGLTITEECIFPLREKIAYLAKDFFSHRRPVADFHVDAFLTPDEIDFQLVYCIEALQPFGYGHPSPLFCGEEWFLEDKKEVGQEGRHLQLLLSKGEYLFPAISFNGKRMFPQLEKYSLVSPFFNLSFNRWRGEEKLQLLIQGIRCCDEFEKEGIFLVDRRGLQYKQQYLKELIGRDEGILVFINTLKQMERIKKIFPGRRNLLFSHQGSFSTEEYKGKIKHLLLYDLPLQFIRLKDLVSFLENNSESGKIAVHLLYGKEKFRENYTLLQATVPSAAVLEQVLHFLREMTASNSLTLKTARENLLQVLPFQTTRTLLEKSMGILRDAEYLEISDEKLRVKNNDKESFCIILENLWRIQSFSNEKNLWRETLNWQKYLLEAEGEVILDCLKDS